MRSVINIVNMFMQQTPKVFMICSYGILFQGPMNSTISHKTSNRLSENTFKIYLFKQAFYGLILLIFFCFCNNFWTYLLHSIYFVAVIIMIDINYFSWDNVSTFYN